MGLRLRNETIKSMTAVSIVLVLAASLAFAGFATLLLLKALFRVIESTSAPARIQPQD
jgi:hypothetical protein